MPYILKQNRSKYDELVDQLVFFLGNDPVSACGNVNYVVSSLMWKLFLKRRGYSTANSLVGVLECVKQELYRRQISPLEDEKIIENGDIEV